MQPGSLFFAVPGSKADGSAFVPQALDAAPRPWWPKAVPAPRDGMLGVVVPDVRVALAQAAARFYPRQPDTIVAVTGTSGKTSVAAFVRQIWAALGTPGGLARHDRRGRAGGRDLRRR